MQDLELGKKIACTPAEKARCELTVFLLLSFAEQARKEGLHALAGPARNHKVPDFLRRGLEYLSGVDEIEPEKIEIELNKMLDPGDGTGRTLLERILCLQGLIYIIRGAETSVLFEKLAAYFGESYYSTLRENIRERFRAIHSERKGDFQPTSFLAEVRTAEILIPETGHLETVTAKVSDADVDFILMQYANDVAVLNNALSGASGPTQVRFLERLASGRLLEFKDERENAGAQPPYVLEADQLALVNRIRGFARAGELSFAEADLTWPATDS